MYRNHFGLNQSPFNITPNPAFFYAGSKRGDILEALIYAVAHGEGIIKVTGEVGSGKTMLCRMLEDMMPSNVEVIYLVNPTLSREEVVFAIAGELEIPTEGKRPDEVIRLLHQDLIAKHINGKQVVLLVEEAQAMPLETLEEIRLFSNLETAHHKLLQIVLFGQPELDENLNLPRMRQLKERITHSFTVPPMPASVISEFLMFRLRAAGYRGPDLFTKAAVTLLAAVSQGIVRRINILADKSLLAAFSENTHSIEVRHIKAAILDSEFSTNKKVPLHLSWMAQSIIALAFLMLAAFVGWKIAQPKPADASPKLVNNAYKSPAKPVTTASNASTTENSSHSVANETKENTSPSPTNLTLTSDSTLSTSTSSVNSPAKIPDAKAKAPDAHSDLFQERVTSSKNWLTETPKTHYTIQLSLVKVDDLTHAKTILSPVLKRMGVELGIEHLFLFPTKLGGKNRFGIAYSNFGSREEAWQKRLELEAQWGYRAQLRTIEGLLLEIERTKSASLW
jgi:MSHA biogenesis protein MshM